MQGLLNHETEMRVIFCRIVNRQKEGDVNVGKNSFFTDRACFTRKGITNFQYEQVYADENLHAVKVKYFHKRISN